VTITAKRAKDVIAMNRKGSKPDLLDDKIDEEVKAIPVNYENGVGQDSLTRFDSSKKRSGKSNRRSNNRPQNKPAQVPENKGIENKGEENKKPENKKTPRFQKPIKKTDNSTKENEK